MILVIALLFASSVPALAGTCPTISDCPQDFMPAAQIPSEAEKDRLAAALADARAAQAAAERTRAALAEGRRLARDEFLSKLPAWKKWSVTEAQVEEAIRADPLFSKLEKQCIFAVLTNGDKHDEAIRMTVAIYGLVPPTFDFHGDSRAASPNMVARRWLPHFSEWETQDQWGGKWRKRTKGELSSEANSQGAAAGALTTGDGDIRIFGNAFNDPDHLAALIYHETSHWVDVAGKSGGFRFSDLPEVSFLTEKRAYEQQAAMLSRLGQDPIWFLTQAEKFRLQATISADLHLTWEDVKAGYPNWIGTDRKGLLGSVPSPSEVSAGDEALLARKMAEMKASVDEQRDYQERLREFERQGREAHPIEIHPTFPGQDPPGYVRVVPTRPGEGPQPVAGIKVDNGLAEMMLALKVARMACADPSSVTDGMLAQIDWSHMLRGTNPDQFRRGMSACESRVFDREVAFARSWTPGTTLGSGAIRDAATEPSSSPVGGGTVPTTPSHDPVWQNVRPILPH